MMNIGRRMSQMIASKQVAIAPCVFQKHYAEIFPLAEHFLRLLQPHKTEDTTEEAKMLFERLAFSLLCPEPNAFPLALLAMEAKNFETSNTYFAQDHFVHSIYLYILGIFLFFNHPGFHQMIIAQTRTKNSGNEEADPYYEKIKRFVRDWKYFALYHDIGYVFEKTLNKDGSISEESTLSPEFFKNFVIYDLLIAYELALKSFSRFVLYSWIRERSTETIEDLLTHVQEEESGFDHFRNVLCDEDQGSETNQDINKLISALSSVSKYKKLAYVQSYDDFSVIAPFVISDNYVVAVFDTRNSLCEIKAKLKQGELAYYSKERCVHSKEQVQKLEKIEISKGYHYAVYVDLSDEVYKAIVHNLHLSGRENDIPMCTKLIYDKLGTSIRFSLMQSQLHESHYKIYKYTKECVPYESICESYIPQVLKEEVESVFQLFSEIITSQAKKAVKEITPQSLFNKSGVDEALSKIKDSFGALNSKYISEEIAHKSVIEDNKEDILYHCICTIYTEFSKLYGQELADIAKEDNRIVIKPFRHVENPALCEENKCLFKEALKKTTENLQRLGFIKTDQTVQQFLKYEIEYGYCDHGIASSSILACIMSHYVNLAYNDTTSLLSYAFPCFVHSTRTVLEDEYTSVNTTSVFAILVHNIYGDRYCSQCDNRYMQDVELNAFSYFAALCDNLQIWNRPHQYNPGIHTPPFSWFITETDIEIYDNILYVTCTTNDLIKTQSKLKNNLDEYLLGARDLIRLNLSEVE